MKKVKFLAAFCFVIFISNFTLPNTFGQQTDQTKQTDVVVQKDDSNTTVENKPVVEDENIVDFRANKNQYAKRDDDRYRIGFQDTLTIQVFKHPELNQTLNVNADGTINLYRVDRPVVAVCKTEKELEDLVVALYTNFLRKPYVNVRAVEQRSQPFAVVGAVQKPGSFYLNKKVRLIQLLALAGGYDVEKAGSNIQIARIGNLAGCQEVTKDEDNYEVEFLSYNLFEVLKGKQNPWVQPGDIITVTEAQEAYVVGNVVNEAEKILLKEPVTLTQAIARAGGVAKAAKTSKVRIQRQKAGTPVRTELVFDLKDIAENKVPDPILEANDIVEVPTDSFKAARNKFLDVLTGGLGNVFYRIP